MASINPYGPTTAGFDYQVKSNDVTTTAGPIAVTSYDRMDLLRQKVLGIIMNKMVLFDNPSRGEYEVQLGNVRFPIKYESLGIDDLGMYDNVWKDLAYKNNARKFESVVFTGMGMAAVGNEIEQASPEDKAKMAEEKIRLDVEKVFKLRRGGPIK